MKQTIITMLVLGGVAMAAQTTENVAFTSPSSTITTVNQYNLSEDWSLSLEFIGAPRSYNPKGTTIIDSDVLGVKVYAKKGGDEAIVTIGSKTETKSSLNWTLWDIGWQYEAPITLNLTYTAGTAGTAGELALSVILGDGSELSFSNAMKYDGDSVVSLTTGISQDQVSASASNGMKYWTLPTGTFTGTATSAPIPEPATATLSLLALAGLAARRRRK